MKKFLKTQKSRLKLAEVCRRLPEIYINGTDLHLTSDLLIDAHWGGNAIFRRTEGEGIRLCIIAEYGGFLVGVEWDKENIVI